jgi:hypothetical protein
VEQRRQLHCGKLTAAIPAGYTAVVKPSKMNAIQTQVVTEALMLFACERPVCANSGRSLRDAFLRTPERRISLVTVNVPKAPAPLASYGALG